MIPLGKFVNVSGLPFEPQPYEQLRARYPDALKVFHDIDKVLARLAPAPAELRENVFDFFSGHRLIINLVAAKGQPYLHLSAYIHISAAPSIATLSLAQKLEFLKAQLDAIGFSFAIGDRPHYVGEGGSPHWIWNLKTGRPL